MHSVLHFRNLSISMHSLVMLKILQARLQHYTNCELPDVQAGFRKGRGTRDQIANICWIMEKRVPEKDLTDREEIKKWWQEYTEELHKKVTHINTILWSLT